MPRRTLLATVLTVLSYLAGIFSLWIQLDPFAWAGIVLPVVSAASGAAFGVSAYLVAGRLPPRGFALIGVGLGAAAGALAVVVHTFA